MKHKVRIITDLLVDSLLYRSVGPVDHLADGTLDARIAMAMRLKDSVKNVEGVEVLSIQTENLR